MKEAGKEGRTEGREEGVAYCMNLVLKHDAYGENYPGEPLISPIRDSIKVPSSLNVFLQYWNRFLVFPLATR